MHQQTKIVPSEFLSSQKASTWKDRSQPKYHRKLSQDATNNRVLIRNLVGRSSMHNTQLVQTLGAPVFAPTAYCASRTDQQDCESIPGCSWHLGSACGGTSVGFCLSRYLLFDYLRTHLERFLFADACMCVCVCVRVCVRAFCFKQYAVRTRG